VGGRSEPAILCACSSFHATSFFAPGQRAILGDADYDTWLIGIPEQAQALLKPYPADEMRAYPVSKSVNTSKK